MAKDGRRIELIPLSAIKPDLTGADLEEIVLSRHPVPEAPNPLTWEWLCEAQPRLLDLEAFALQQHKVRDSRYCANWAWFGMFKPTLLRCVGFYADAQLAPECRTPEAYDRAYRHLYDLLPDCRHEGWCSQRRYSLV